MKRGGLARKEGGKHPLFEKRRQLRTSLLSQESHDMKDLKGAQGSQERGPSLKSRKEKKSTIREPFIFDLDRVEEGVGKTQEKKREKMLFIPLSRKGGAVKPERQRSRKGSGRESSGKEGKKER